MKVNSTATFLLGGLLLTAMPTLAHHAFMAEFDQNQPVTMEGVVTAIKWQNPHTFFYVDVKDQNGKTVNWELETGSPNSLRVRNWTKETLKPGDHVFVRGYRARTNPKLAAARSVTLPDGRTVFGGQMDDGGPKQ
jgi:hypothetical protein